MKSPRTILLLTTVICLCHARTHAASVSIGAAKDNCIFAEHDTLSNGAGPSFHAGRNGIGDIRRALIRFDLTGVLYAGATVDSAVLRLNMSMTQPGSRVVSLHRLLADWGEGTSVPVGGGGGGANGAPATANDATWTQRFYGSPQPWATAGGDFNAPASASRPVGALGVYSWRSAGMTADVAQWLANPSQNFGWIVTGDEVAPFGSAKRFDSRQAPVANNRPMLTIFYTLPTGAPALPGATRLFPVHPNPFNPSAIIRYHVNGARQARVAVYDTAGRLVRVLVDGLAPDGTNDVVWNGDDARGLRVASGVYLVRFSAANAETQVQKAVLLK